jgi:hypothetical protein
VVVLCSTTSTLMMRSNHQGIVGDEFCPDLVGGFGDLERLGEASGRGFEERLVGGEQGGHRVAFVGAGGG